MSRICREAAFLEELSAKMGRGEAFNNEEEEGLAVLYGSMKAWETFVHANERKQVGDVPDVEEAGGH